MIRVDSIKAEKDVPVMFPNIPDVPITRLGLLTNHTSNSKAELRSKLMAYQFVIRELEKKSDDLCAAYNIHHPANPLFTPAAVMDPDTEVDAPVPSAAQVSLVKTIISQHDENVSSGMRLVHLKYRAKQLEDFLNLKFGQDIDARQLALDILGPEIAAAAAARAAQLQQQHQQLP